MEFDTEDKEEFSTEEVNNERDSHLHEQFLSFYIKQLFYCSHHHNDPDAKKEENTLESELHTWEQIIGSSSSTLNSSNSIRTL